jgi:hypothetical protein
MRSGAATIGGVSSRLVKLVGVRAALAQHGAPRSRASARPAARGLPALETASRLPRTPRRSAKGAVGEALGHRGAAEVRMADEENFEPVVWASVAPPPLVSLPYVGGAASTAGGRRTADRFCPI